MARATGGWSGLRDQGSADRGDCGRLSADSANAAAGGSGAAFGARAACSAPGSSPAAARLLERIEAVTARSYPGGPEELDAQLRELIAIEDEIEWTLGLLLAEMADRGAWARLLFAGAGHYSVERLGICRSTAEDRVRLARLLRGLPIVRKAYEEGRLGLHAALLICRKLGRGPIEKDVESAWVMRAEEATIKRLRDDVRVRGGETTGDASVPRGFDRRIAGTIPDSAPTMPPEDAAWRDFIRRAPGMARERITRLGNDAARVGMADSFLRLRLPADLASDFLSSIESTCVALTHIVESVPWDEPWPDPNPAGSLAAARMFSTRCRRVPAWVGLLAMIEDYAATWDDPDAAPKRKSDAVYIRDGWRCMAPGCTSRRNLEDHHVVYRSRAGTNDLSNRICLCRFHHQEGEHGGLASCRGVAPLGIRWRLGKDGLGGFFVNERRIDAEAAIG
jgi:5-methylcytosine-specific restriction endonuclease McrA